MNKTDKNDVIRVENIGQYVQVECPVCGSAKVTLGADGRAKPTINCGQCNTKTVLNYQ